MENEQIIEVQNLTKLFTQRGRPGITALNHISFSVRKGEIFGLLGPNGAGKSTAIKILTTLQLPTSGTARVRGFDVASQPRDVRRQICAVIQENAIEVYLSVKNNFQTFGRFHGLRPAEIDRRSAHVVELFGLKEYWNERGIDLSGGIKRRVQVAKMFLVDRPVIFLDEATTGMDTFNKRATLDAIREESHKGRTILLTTHLLEEAEELCDSIVIIHRGTLLARGSVEEIKSMGLQLYSVSLTTPPESLIDRRWFDRWNPVTVEQSRSGFLVSIRSAAQALDLIQAARAADSLAQFEISRASLEDVFMELIDRKGERHP